MSLPRNAIYIDEEAPLFEDETLERVATPAAASVPPPRPPPVRSNQPLVDLAALSCHPQHYFRDLDNPLQEFPCVDREMTNLAVVPESEKAAATTGVRPSATQDPPASVSSTSFSAEDEADLHETAAAALAVRHPQSIERVDSKNHSEDAVPQLSPGKREELKVQTNAASSSTAPVAAAEESLTDSPTLHKHMIHDPKSNANLPVVQSNSDPGDGSTHSPRKTSGPLPSFQELAQLASVASQESRAPPTTHQHKPSFSSTTSHSPRIAYHPPFAGGVQTSPISFAPSSATTLSPASTLGEASHYGSPYPQSAPYHAYYPDRRPSAPTEGPQAFSPNVPSLPSGSSSESHGEGASTAQTTPIETSTVADGTPRPILPPPPGMMNPNVVGSFKCDFDGCSAPPFQTQYLLSSHKNVHSSSRPHYCPVPSCPRSEGGKGFKRKNEMIRHGLVHNSPGYECPFCPDRGHRYPRPDNLQRHVRVHHVDKDKDDPALREVLGQRPQGAIQKQRRRRAPSTTIATEAPPLLQAPGQSTS